MKSNFSKKKYLLLIGIILAISLGSITCYRQYIFDYYNDNYVPVLIIRGRIGDSRVELANSEIPRVATSIWHFISGCKMIPENYQDVIERTREGQPFRGDPEHFESVRKKANVSECERFPFQVWEDDLFDKASKELAYPWIDPWGRPYQIRYDLERGKLQVRSQGRYLQTDSDDILAETSFNGKSYKEQVEYCKTVPKDDLNCIFNRGWH